MTYKEKFNKKYGYKKNASHSLKEISAISGYSLKGLEVIYAKGIGAYKTNPRSVRPGVKSPEQWAYGRVYSAVMGGKAQKIDKSHLKMSKTKKVKVDYNNFFGIEGISKKDNLELMKLFGESLDAMPGSPRQKQIQRKMAAIKSKYKNKKKTMKKSNKMNDFMKAKEKARKANKSSFSYNGNMYKRSKTKTGMVIYKKSK